MSVADAIAVEQLSFAYDREIQALCDVSLRAARGECVAVVGANGSGKTTLMKLIMRLLPPRKGRVLLEGADIRSMKSASLYGRVGMVFQNPADQLFAATVEQDVAFGPRNLGLPDTEVKHRVDDALAAVDVSSLRRRPIHHLSFGEQKRVCLAGVLAMSPRVLVMDEPTAGLDPAGESHMVELLLKLKSRGDITMLVSTHAMDLLPLLADRICVLSRGRVLREGTPREIFADRPTMTAAGLRLPLIAQLFHELAATKGLQTEQLPLTLDEAIARIAQWMGVSKP